MTPIADAATTLAAKAQRMLARVSCDQPKAAEKSQRAAGLLQLASEISNQPSYRTLALAVSAAPITARDREVAATEIYSLAMRRAASGSTRRMMIGKPIALKPGWVAGGDK